MVTLGHNNVLIQACLLPFLTPRRSRINSPLPSSFMSMAAAVKVYIYIYIYIYINISLFDSCKISLKRLKGIPNVNCMLFLDHLD